MAERSIHSSYCRSRDHETQLFRCAETDQSRVTSTPTNRKRGGFTLIEIMIVLAIIMVIMTMGVPSVIRGLSRDDLSRAMNDTVEGCKTARDRAILHGVPYEFVLTSEGQMNVNALPPPRGESLLPDAQAAP